MRKNDFVLNTLSAISLVAVVFIIFLFYSDNTFASEGWCGHTDTSKCCEDFDLKGKCSCVCIPGNCHCGPRLTAPGHSDTLSPDTKLKVVNYKDGKVVKKKTMTNKKLQGIDAKQKVKAKTLETKPKTTNTISATPKVELTPKGGCCAEVLGGCVSCCYKSNGCSGNGDWSICGSVR